MSSVAKECNFFLFTQLLYVCLSRSVGTAVGVQSDRCPVCPWIVPSSTSSPVSTDSSQRPPTCDNFWSSSDRLLNPGAPLMIWCYPRPQCFRCPFSCCSLIGASIEPCWVFTLSCSCNLYLYLYFSACADSGFRLPLGKGRGVLGLLQFVCCHLH